MQTDTKEKTALKQQIRTIRQYIILLIIICIASLATLPVTSIFSMAQTTSAPASSINAGEPPYHWEACFAWTEKALYLEMTNHTCMPSAKKHQKKLM